MTEELSGYVEATKNAVLDTVTTEPMRVGELADSIQQTFPELCSRDALDIAYEAVRQLVNSGQLEKV